ncbi:hypothetical protein CMV_008642 [Castanea mollissima]|uniref:Uncharacterized protein n=1 Tax=Castanea mollissima TaxID=60419 RepID=A0A8J4RBS7_9ROSI|nr:hypothetical protein CMV_008642 [Castanea mollissima]
MNEIEREREAHTQKITFENSVPLTPQEGPSPPDVIHHSSQSQLPDLVQEELFARTELCWWIGFLTYVA